MAINVRETTGSAPMGVDWSGFDIVQATVTFFFGDGLSKHSVLDYVQMVWVYLTLLGSVGYVLFAGDLYPSDQVLWTFMIYTLVVLSILKFMVEPVEWV